jgi:hypothetical protein
MSEHAEVLRDAPPSRGSSGLSLPVIDSRGDGVRRARSLSRRAQAALPLATVGAGMLVRRVIVRPPDVVFVKGIVEASDGLAALFAEQGGELLLVAPHEREAELCELLADLEAELGAPLTSPPTCPSPKPPARPVTVPGESGRAQ